MVMTMMARRLILSDVMVVGHDDADDANAHRDDDVDSKSDDVDDDDITGGHNDADNSYEGDEGIHKQ